MTIYLPFEFNIIPPEKVLRIGVFGFGKTGKAVSSILLKEKTTHLEWVVRASHALEHRSVPEFLGIDSDEPGLIYSLEEFLEDGFLDKHPVDIIVDFSSEDAIYSYGPKAIERSIAVVTAISFYPKEQQRYLNELGKSIKILWSPNITLGINFLILAAKTLQSILPGLDIEIVEEHFKLKSEVSGTAIKIADALSVDHKDIKMIRAGGIIGVHEIIFGFPYQTVRLRHESISREAFGRGAHFASLELTKKDKVGLYKMEDILGPYFVSSNIEYLPDVPIDRPKLGVVQKYLFGARNAFRKRMH